MKMLVFGAVTGMFGFIYGKIQGTEHPWRRYGYARNYTPPASRQL